MYDLKRLISYERPTPSDEEMLRDLQGNILKSHGRAFSRHLFLRFTNQASAVALVSRLARRVTSEEEQRAGSARRGQSGSYPTAPVARGPERLFVSLMVSHSGYDRLEVAPEHFPRDPEWTRGMAASDLGDPPVGTWEPGFRGPIDAHLLLAYGRKPRDRVMLSTIERSYYALLVTGGARVVARASGTVLRRSFGEKSRTVEHFGYADGRSQPLIVEEQVAREERERAHGAWNPAFHLDTALVPHAGSSPASHGSYFVFRKLEQDVAGFLRAVASADACFPRTDPARTAALAFGRFEDGTPITHSSVADRSWSNDFDYAEDSDGQQCPFSAHIRKMNPRSDDAEERSHLFVRRGIPYDDRNRTQQRRFPTPGQGGPRDADRQPTGGVGLLFMCYNAEISRQFAYVQGRWANDPDYLAAGSGVDPIIGQSADMRTRTYGWPADWGKQPSVAVDFPASVRMLGGGYFFAPPISFLRDLPQYTVGRALGS